MIKRIFIGILIIIATLFVGIILFINILFPPPVSKGRMEREFKRNKEKILMVTEYFKDSAYEDIYIIISISDISDDIYMFTGLETGDVAVEDQNVAEALRYLFEKVGYEVMVKNKNTIYFQRWSSLDSGSGIAYSINGEEPILEYLTKLAGLSVTEEGWYYYEED